MPGSGYDEHLVSLGFQVDPQSYRKMVDSVQHVNAMFSHLASHITHKMTEAGLSLAGLDKGLEKIRQTLHKAVSGPSGGQTPGSGAAPDMKAASDGLKTFAEKATQYFGEAAVAAGTFAAAIAGGTASLLNGLGQQEIQMEMLSRSMWTTQKQAMAFSLSLKALGANLQDLYLSPTLLKQYQALHAEATQMQTPGDYNSQIQLVQSVSLGFAKMRLEAYYALQWIGYYFTKYMAAPLGQLRDGLQGVNQAIVKNMPVWTRRVAGVMVTFVQAGEQIGGALATVWGWFQTITNSMPGWAKAVAAAFAVIGLAMKASPFGRLMMALTAAMLLFNDFETYLHHGKAALAPFWSAVMRVDDALKKIGADKAIIDGIAAAFATWAAVKGILMSITLATKLWAAAQALVNIAMDANPLGLIITAVGALVAGIVLLIENWKTVKRVAVDAWDSITKAVGGAVQWIRQQFTALGTAAGGVWTAFLGSATSALNWVISAIDDMIRTLDRIPGVRIPLIPTMGMPGATHAHSVGYHHAPSHHNVHHYNRGPVHITQHVHVHGTSPHATGDAVARSFNRHLHNIRGVIG